MYSNINFYKLNSISFIIMSTSLLSHLQKINKIYSQKEEIFYLNESILPQILEYVEGYYQVEIGSKEINILSYTATGVNLKLANLAHISHNEKGLEIKLNSVDNLLYVPILPQFLKSKQNSHFLCEREFTT